MPSNININDANFSFGPISGFFYTISKSINSLLQIEADGTVINTFPLTFSQLRGPVVELHWDGTFFWTMEDLPSNLGMVIKKWRLYPHKTFTFPNVTPSELRWQDEVTLLNQPNVKYESRAFAIEHYHRLLVGSADRGDTFIKVNDTTDIDIGDDLYLGPSDVAGFIGNEENILVVGVNHTTGAVSFLKDGGLDSSYGSSNPVDFSKGVWVFNDHSYSGKGFDGRGSLSKFDYPSKELATVDTGRKYHGVNAADFDQNRISFVRGPMLMTINLDTISFDLESSFTFNVIEADKISLSTVYDLITDLDTNLYYKLQQRHTTEDRPTGTYTTINYAPLYNFQLETNLPFVNSTAIGFTPTRFAITGGSPKSRKFTVIAEVRDQFNFPVLGKSVQFTATVNNLGEPGIPGTLDPAVDITNVSGTATSEYTPSLTEIDILIDVQAQVL